MYSSVKFLEPTVTVTFELSGFDWISCAVPVVDVELLLLPQAAMARARIEAASTANSARNRVFLLIERASSTVWDTSPPRGVDGILCGRALSLQLEPSRGQEPLQSRERELDDQREQGDQDRARQHPVVAVDVSRQNEVAEGQDTGERRDRRGGDDVDRGRAHAAHDRRHGERQL